MEHIYFTPGPSQLYPTVSRHIQEAQESNMLSISHRGDIFHTMFAESIENFKKLYHVPKDHYVFFLSSATEAMERIIENLCINSSLHFVNGSFSELFYKTAAQTGVNAQKIEVPVGQGFDFTTLNTPGKFEVACFTQNETSTGVLIPMEDIYAFKKRFPKKLIALDIVSSAPFVDINFSLIDCVFFSVQKGFGLPAGLGVLVLKPEVIKKALWAKKRKKSQGSYHTFENFLKYYEKNETPETPNVMNIFLLGKICKDFLDVGIDKIRKQTEKKADKLYKLTKSNTRFIPFVVSERLRSKTVIVLNVQGGSVGLSKYLKAKGYIVGSGYRDLKEKQIRIANFPAHSEKDITSLINAINRY